MARNRRRERSRRQQPGADAESVSHDIMPDAEVAPDPLAHASAEADIAEAQLAFGRPELAEVPDSEELEEYEEELAGRGKSAGALATKSHRERHDHPEQTVSKQSMPARLVGFLRGSWLELQRVHWPDRQQVFQATGVVIGFVIVAGTFLGLADLVASKLVNLIIK